MKVQVNTADYAVSWMWRVAVLSAALLLLGMSGMASGADSRQTAQFSNESLVVSPCEGYILMSEYPGGSPLVEVGSIVTPDTIVAYVQSMDRTPVRAGVSGIVLEVLFTEMTPVSTGDPLFRVWLTE